MNVKEFPIDKCYLIRFPACGMTGIRQMPGISRDQNVFDRVDGTLRTVKKMLNLCVDTEAMSVTEFQLTIKTGCISHMTSAVQ
jgi:hypothetical protein